MLMGRYDELVERSPPFVQSCYDGVLPDGRENAVVQRMLIYYIEWPEYVLTLLSDDDEVSSKCANTALRL